MSDPSAKKIFTLSQVAGSIKKTLSDRYKSSFWVKAEMNKLNLYSHSGHCYPDLVEKSDGKIIAEMRSVLWKGDYQFINQRFIDVLQEPLKDGITVLMLVSITFDAVYGVSLRVLDIDPSFSLGELTREKQESINRLVKEEIFDSNKKLTFPLLPKRLAIISVETSKGLADFLKIIDNNVWNYKFEYQLFPALLQGDKAPASILSQLKYIKDNYLNFDAVALIRGGGGDIGLTCYNNYPLARELAQFPLPILTGIGHATNETVSEMVAFKNAITPSELADFLIQRFHQFAVPVLEAEEFLIRKVPSLIQEKKREVYQLSRQFQLASQNALRTQTSEITMLKNSIKILAKQQLNIEGNALKSIERQVNLLHPNNILKRGFSLSYQNGKLIKDINDIDEEEELITQFYDGEVRSTIKTVKKNNDG
ncbi:exodeoxyribonuclease VII large subunit [Albibacterium bauzanense]|uniref:Exodeoxyribonuclease 7 large subunit n=1 Tax=Albibacterium bauzanense TaxID=653929 RepID=A0A4R1LVX5_9SPHI|nr:exodeoxyribonuclease VII large subunit [Albibacterium bauzanense]TCK82927.1 exodeoxyribonuclease VII large subunit [Albibacterium bauzanense]